MFCSYGCGNKAKYKFKNGKYCCSKNWQSCEIYRLQRKKITTRLMKDKNIIEKISKANKNKTAWNKGKKLQYQVWNKGKTGVYSEETLNKIAKFSKGRKGYWTGRKRSYETIKKIIKNHRDVSGPNNPSWKGGISCEPYCDVWLDKDFKQSIKDRDGNRCLNPDCWRNCNHLPMHIHHIDHNKKNCNPNNLITVCNSCNGRAKKDRKWHTSWYQTIINKRYNY